MKSLIQYPLEQNPVQAPAPQIVIPSNFASGALPIGQPTIAVGGVHGEQIVNTLLGQYYALTRAGLVWNFSTVVAGVAIPISSGTAPPFGIWNPSDSGKLVVPLIYTNAYVSGTNVQTGIGLGWLAATGSSLATAAPLSALTKVAPTNTLLGFGGSPSDVTGFSASTLTTAGNWMLSIGQNTFTGAATVPTSINGPMMMDFMGTLLIPPGNMVYPMGNAASVGLYQQSIIAAVLPYPN
jgi:hypothetical protein